jgi:hypothetical protein
MYPFLSGESARTVRNIVSISPGQNKVQVKRSKTVRSNQGRKS